MQWKPWEWKPWENMERLIGNPGILHDFRGTIYKKPWMLP
jgi:hypothetical protein